MFYNHICFDDFNHLKIIQVIKLYSIIIIDNWNHKQFAKIMKTDVL